MTAVNPGASRQAVVEAALVLLESDLSRWARLSEWPREETFALGGQQHRTVGPRGHLPAHQGCRRV